MILLGRGAFAFTIVMIVFCLAAAAALAAPAQEDGLGVSLTLDTSYKIAGLVSLVMSTSAMFYAWFVNRRKDVDRRFHEGSKRMDRHDLRLQALEQEQKSMPGAVDLHRLELQLTSISGDMKAMAATMSGMHESLKRTENIVSRHEDHLRGNGQ